jgi:excisionase family DNA binding protein
MKNPALASEEPHQFAYRPSDAARLMGIGRTFLYELIASDKLKSIKLGGRRLVTRQAIEECLKAHEEPATTSSCQPAKTRTSDPRSAR